MTRTERIRKLTNAIKDYRGAYNAATGQWIRPAQHMALARVTKWLQELDLDIPVCLDRIDNFVNVKDMTEFMDALRYHHPDCDCSACCPN